MNLSHVSNYQFELYSRAQQYELYLYTSPKETRHPRARLFTTFSAYDDIVDRNSVNPGKQRFEKMIAGMYLGEIVRLVLLDLCKQGIVFGEEAIEVLEREGNSRAPQPH